MLVVQWVNKWTIIYVCVCFEIIEIWKFNYNLIKLDFVKIFRLLLLNQIQEARMMMDSVKYSNMKVYKLFYLLDLVFYFVDYYSLLFLL